MALAFLDEDTVISGGGNNKETWFWNRKSGRGIEKVVGKGKKIWAAGISGSKIAWGNTYDYSSHNNRGPLEKYFDLETFSTGKVGNLHFNRISTRWNGYSLHHTAGGNYGRNDAVLVVEKDGKEIGEIVRGLTDGYSHRTYGFTEDGFIVSGGSNGHLLAYNREGKLIARFVGHFGGIWSIATEGKWLVSGGDDQRIILWDLSRLKDYNGEVLKIYPTLTIFVSDDNEWVVYTKSGYFDASPDGGKFIGWHVNQGYDKEALWFPADRFYNSFYNPEIVKLTYKYGSEDLALKELRKKKQEVAKVLPPVIKLISPANRYFETEKTGITLNYCIEELSQEKTKKVEVLVNGAIVQKRTIKRRRTKERCFTEDIPLQVGDNTIVITAENRYAKANPVILKVKRKGIETIADIEKPDLYLVAIGVSNYGLKYSDDDAIAFAELFRGLEGTIYRKVHIKLLVNEDATEKKVRQALSWLMREPTQKDVAVLFVSGHGERDEIGDYYFIAYDTDIKDLVTTGVPKEYFMKVVKALNCKKIFFFDTCKSGKFPKFTRKSSENGIREFLHELREAGSGSIIFSATTGNGYALESSKWRHGVFTKAIIDGLKYKGADLYRDGRITPAELAEYIRNRVKELTGGTQKPEVLAPEGVFPDFPLYPVK